MLQSDQIRFVDEMIIINIETTQCRIVIIYALSASIADIAMH